MFGMKKIITQLLIFILGTLSVIFSQDDDVFLTIGNVDEDNQTFDILYSSPEDVAGFQFGISGIAIMSIDHEIDGWAGKVSTQRIAGKKITIVPILRAGIGMLEGVLNLIPSAKVSVLGLERDEETLEVRTYYKKLVPDVANRIAMIIDPMLATGNSLIAAIDVLKASGCKDIRVMVLVAAPEGIAKVEAAHPDVRIYTASIDQGLNEDGYIVPGLGDAGDKIFGSVQKD